ncbi:hypothetical protein L6452_35819 [Arctium lappa]|uniref:Uncharacterized protein n=1 Tax=Arctium lappa TaxID=4217 RepID=A0ACB8Y913_ARCLA|nr:hypothetical protein L6452_35819 [Arctium lappa]
MVHTIHTRVVSRGRGRGRGHRTRRTPYGLGLSRGSFGSHRSSARHVSGHHVRSDSPIHTRETSSRESVRQESSLEPSEEYMPRTPTREDMVETIEILRGESTKLRKSTHRAGRSPKRIRNGECKFDGRASCTDLG